MASQLEEALLRREEEQKIELKNDEDLLRVLKEIAADEQAKSPAKRNQDLLDEALEMILALSGEDLLSLDDAADGIVGEHLQAVKAGGIAGGKKDAPIPWRATAKRLMPLAAMIVLLAGGAALARFVGEETVIPPYHDVTPQSGQASSTKKRHTASPSVSESTIATTAPETNTGYYPPNYTGTAPHVTDPPLPPVTDPPMPSWPTLDKKEAEKLLFDIDWMTSHYAYQYLESGIRRETMNDYLKPVVLKCNDPEKAIYIIHQAELMQYLDPEVWGIGGDDPWYYGTHHPEYGSLYFEYFIEVLGEDVIDPKALEAWENQFWQFNKDDPATGVKDTEYECGFYEFIQEFHITREQFELVDACYLEDYWISLVPEGGIEILYEGTPEQITRLFLNPNGFAVGTTPFSPYWLDHNDSEMWLAVGITSQVIEDALADPDYSQETKDRLESRLEQIRQLEK